MEFPKPQSEAAKELAPYLETILMGQAAILERLKYQLHEDGEPSSKHDILDMLIANVVLKGTQPVATKAKVRPMGSGPSIIR